MTLDDELNALGRQLEAIDQAAVGPGTIRLLVTRIKNLKIKMYQESGHQLPHLHVDYCGAAHAASYSLDGSRLAGSLDRKYDRVVLSWIASNRDNLFNIWKSLQSGADAMIVVRETSWSSTA